MKYIMHSKPVYFAAFILFISAVKYLIAVNMPIHPDEAYWWMFSRMPAMSYYDHGPGVAFFIKFFTAIAGNNIYALKLAGLVSALALLTLIYNIAKELKLSETMARLAVITYMLLPGIFLGSFLTLHDSFFIPVWTATLYAGIRYLVRREMWSLLLMFFLLGIGALSKNTMVLFVPGLVLWLVFTPAEYKILKKPGFWAGILLTAIVILPLLYWNYANDWAGFEMSLNMSYAGSTDREDKGLLLFLLGQFLSFTPVLFLFFLIIPALLKKQLVQIFKEPEWGMLFANAWIMPAFFMAISNKSAVQANWVYPSYAAIVILVLGVTDRYLPRFKKPLNWYLFFLLPALVLISAPTMLKYFPNILQKSEKAGVVNMNPGYDKVIQAIEQKHQAVDPGAILIANTYQDAARASWYLEGHPFVSSLNVMKKNQYSFWPRPETGNNYFVFHTTDRQCAPTEFLLIFLAAICEEAVEFPEENLLDGKGGVLYRYKTWHCKNLEPHWKSIGIDLPPNRAWSMLFANQAELTKIAKNKKNLDVDKMFQQLTEWYYQGQSCK